MKHKILGVIPAKGKSRRLEEKNKRLLLGKPLISYTIESAIKSRYIDKIVVSTEDSEIYQIASCYNNVTLIRRPISLAKDSTPTIDVIKHALDFLSEKEGYRPDIIALLQPTSPLRTAVDIDKAIRLFLNCKCESVISVCEAKPYWCLISSKGTLEFIFRGKNKRNKALKAYTLNGAIYITSLANLKKYDGFFARRVIPYIMPPERSIDIDTKFDLELAEFFMRKR